MGLLLLTRRGAALPMVLLVEFHTFFRTGGAEVLGAAFPHAVAGAAALELSATDLLAADPIGVAEKCVEYVVVAKCFSQNRHLIRLWTQQQREHTRGSCELAMQNIDLAWTHVSCCSPFSGVLLHPKGNMLWTDKSVVRSN